MIVGIDLGTTHSLIAYLDSGLPIVLADRDGRRLLPSALWARPDEAPAIGASALRARAVDPANVIVSSKRLMGRRGGEVATEGLAYTVTGRSGEPAQILAGGREWLPEEVAAEFLRRLKEEAEAVLEETVDRAVITVPAYFHDAQRQATKRAGELAGLQVERIVNEPTAAALAYGLNRLGESARVAVFDLGGGTFDLSLLQLADGVFEVVATNGNTQLGGDDLDQALVDWLQEELAANRGIALSIWADAPSLARLRDAAREIREKLSTTEQATLRLPFVGAEGGVEMVLDRERVETICRPVLEQTRIHCLRALQDAGWQPEELDAVILVGGTTRMPLVRRMAAEWFKREPDISQNPDEAVAAGAAIQAGVLDGQMRDVVLLDVTPLSLGIETFGGLMNVLIPRNSTIPTKAGELFTNAVANQTAMVIRILQGERELAKDNWQLGEFTLEFPPAPRGQARVGVQFSIDANGILEVLVRNTATGEEEKVEIRSAIEISDEQVETMLEDSLEHAFEDMNERIFREARMKAEEMLPAVEAGLQTCGEVLSQEEQQAIEQAVAEVQGAIAAKATNRLKTATEQLDEATQNLAAIMLERVLGGG